MPWVSNAVWSATVSRAERAEDAYRLLVDRVMNPVAKKPFAPRSDEQVVIDRDAQFLKKLKADLEAQGVPAALAETEARRIQRETSTTLIAP